MLSIRVHPCFSFLLCCSTVLSGYCNVSFYLLDILNVMKLHHWEAHGMSHCVNTAETPSNPSRTYCQLSTLKRNIHLPLGRIFKTCLFSGLFNLTSISNVNFLIHCMFFLNLQSTASVAPRHLRNTSSGRLVPLPKRGTKENGT